MASSTPFLSIVTPTLGTYSTQWLDSILQARGDVEYVMVYPPSQQPRGIDDPRVREIVSPHKSGTLQRYVGLLNARGRYIICIDDDDYMHPDLPLAAEHYFQRFPESWLLRLHKELIPSNEPSSFIAPWNPIPDILNLTVVERSDSLRSIPIAPLRNHFKLRYLIQPYRKTGWFMENFNNTVWRTDIVQQALPRIAKVMTICGNLKLIPNSGCERFFGLFIQAFAYRPSLTIGHLLPETAPIRFSKVDPALKKPRFHIFVDFLLFRAFPSYDYFWSLFSAQLIYGTPRTLLKSLRWTLWPPKKK